MKIDSVNVDAPRWLQEQLPEGDNNADGSPDWATFYVNAEGEQTPHTEGCYDIRYNIMANCSGAFGATTDLDFDGKTEIVILSTNPQTGLQDLKVKMIGSSTWHTTSTDIRAGGKILHAGQKLV